MLELALLDMQKWIDTAITVGISEAKVCSKQIELFIGAPLNVLRQTVVLIPKLREGFRLEDHGRDLRRAAKPSSMG